MRYDGIRCDNVKILIVLGMKRNDSQSYKQTWKKLMRIVRKLKLFSEKFDKNA